jgi:hypothetical protein
MRGHMSHLGLFRAASLLLVGILSGCSMTLGPTASAVLTEPRSQHLGASFVSQIRLPREYNTIAGIEEAILGQIHPSSRTDQWRVSALGGYSRAPSSGGSAFGWEGAVRVGYFRGSNGDVTRGGLLSGVKIAAPIVRISGHKDPWERNDLLDVGTLMLVPEFGMNALWTGWQQPQFEGTAMLALRAYFSTNLLP